MIGSLDPVVIGTSLIIIVHLINIYTDVHVHGPHWHEVMHFVPLTDSVH